MNNDVKLNLWGLHKGWFAKPVFVLSICTIRV